MRKLIAAVVVMVICVMPLAAEYPNLYYGPDFNLDSQEWGTTGASDLFGKWAFAFTLGLCDDGAKAAGISMDLVMVLQKCKLDYYWAEKVKTKIVFLPAYDFQNKELSYRIMVAAIGL